MTTRHVFLQHADARGLATLDQRSDHAWADSGLVEEARYVRWLRRGLLARLFGGSKRARQPEELRFVLPFDAAGADVLALCDEPPWLDGDDDPVGSLRRVRGTITCLEPRSRGDDVVLRDLWLDRPPVLRLVESLDFAVLPASGPPVAVCCAMAPLVLAPPEVTALDSFAAELGARAAGVLRGHTPGRGLEPAVCVRLCQGDSVEAIGVVCDPATCRQRFDTTARSAPYRGAPTSIQLIVGDQPGTRLVVRRT